MIETAQDGRWDDGATWKGGAVPSISDTVEVRHSVTADRQPEELAELIVVYAPGGSLTVSILASREIVVTGGSNVRTGGSG